MCAAMEELRIESEKKGTEKKARESALKMYKHGEKLADIVGYTVDTVRKRPGLQSV